MSWAFDRLCTRRMVVVGETVLDSTTGKDGLAVERGNASLPRLSVELKMDHELTIRRSPAHPLILCRQYHDDGRQQGEIVFSVLRAARCATRSSADHYMRSTSCPAPTLP